MRKLATALAAVGLALSAAALPAMAQGKPKQAAPVAAPAKKKLVKKAAPKAAVAKYKSKCKPGYKWNATASINAGACQKVAYKAKGKAKSKVARAPKPAKAKKS